MCSILMFRPTLRISAQANIGRTWCVQNSGESRSMVKRKLACRVKTEAQVKEESKETASDSDSVSNDQKLVEAFQKSAEKMVTYVATS